MPFTDEQPFLDAVFAQYHDDGPRLIYADFLEDAGDPARAELVRLQLALARMPDEHPRRPELANRERRTPRRQSRRAGPSTSATSSPARRSSAAACSTRSRSIRPSSWSAARNCSPRAGAPPAPAGRRGSVAQADPLAAPGGDPRTRSLRQRARQRRRRSARPLAAPEAPRGARPRLQRDGRRRGGGTGAREQLPIAHDAGAQRQRRHHGRRA